MRRGIVGLTSVNEVISDGSAGIYDCYRAWPAHRRRRRRTQQPQTVYRIGFVEAGAASANQHFMDAFMHGLRELGYVPGNNIAVEARWAEGQVEGFRRALADVIKTRPGVIVVSSTLGAVEAKKATSSIPVVFVG